MGLAIFVFFIEQLRSRSVPFVMSESGTMKKFFQQKGFGFITPDDGSEELFVHVKESPDLGEECQGGETVTYDKEWNDRKGKYQAVRCTVTGGGGGGGGKGGGGGYSPW